MRCRAILYACIDYFASPNSAKESHINTNSGMIASHEASAKAGTTDSNGASGMTRTTSGLNTDDSEITDLLEEIAREKYALRHGEVQDRANMIPIDDLCWNVCAADPDEQDMSANMLLPAALESSIFPPAKEQSTIATPEKGGIIVLAEDDEVTRILLHSVLSRAGFTVYACENGQLACEAVRLNGADVVLLDWMMPVMDGPAAVKYLKAHNDTRTIPVVMLTSQTQIDERVVALNNGVQDFLTKPFNARELVARITQQMRWRRMLAVDANTAFAGERIKLYGPAEKEPARRTDGTPISSFFDRIWGESPKLRGVGRRA